MKKSPLRKRKNFFETLKEIINKIVDVIKKHVTNNHLSASEKAVADMSLDDVKRLRTQFLDVIDGAIANLENGVEVYATVKHSAYSFVEEDNRLVTREAKYIIKQIEENYSAVPNTELFNLDYEDISGYKHKSDFVLEIFDGQGNIATNNEIGTVELMKRGAKTQCFTGTAN